MVVTSPPLWLSKLRTGDVSQEFLPVLGDGVSAACWSGKPKTASSIGGCGATRTRLVVRHVAEKVDYGSLAEL
jgi:hypothetical protein